MSFRAPARSALAALALLVAPALTPAHETLHEVRRGQAIAVRAFFVDGEALADAAYQVYSPADPRRPWQEGRTDRRGWLAFVPDVPGSWRVQVIDASGHGLDAVVEVPATASAASPPPPGAEAGSAAFVLRPLVGLAAIGVVFAALFLAWRKKGSGP